jgi:amino acid adenylation domain-containing protein
MSVRADLVGLLRHCAQARGDQVIYRFLADGERPRPLTCGELDRRARTVGRLLQEQGLAGQRVLLVYPPGLDYLAAFFGCLYAGAVAVPVYPPRPNRPMPRLLAVQASAAATVALTCADVLARCERHLPPAEELRWLVTDDLDGSLAEQWRDDGPGELAFLQYTSGSTAAPKGVMLTHANLLANLELIRRAFALTPEDRGVFWLPPYHDMGLIGGILSPLYVGFPATLMAPVAFLQRPARWLRAISRERATVSGAPNFAYDLCVDKVAAAERDELDLASWQVAFNGAEPVRAETLERFVETFGPRGFRREAFFPCYGLAESTLLVSGGGRGQGARGRGFDAGELERHRASPAAAGTPARTLVSCGAGPDGLEVRVVRPETATPCVDGEVGEIWVRGASVARGYWALAETERCFAARLAGGEGPYLRTGDLGFAQGGELFVTGRSKDLVILRGRNHYPQDLEATASASHPALAPGGAAAFAVDVDGEERLVVVAEVRREERKADPRPILDALRRALADEHEVALHAAVLIRPLSLPKTSSGKVRRGACREAFLTGTLQTLAAWQPTAEGAEPVEAATPAPPEEVEAWLVREIARRAGVASADVDPRAPISGHALDSLQAMELMQAVEERLGVPVPMETFFDDVSPAELARRLASEPSAAAEPPAAAGELVGEHPLSHGQLSLWFLHLLDPASPAYNVASAVRVDGPLDVDALRRSFQCLVDRHAVLRTTFEAGGGEPRQRVHVRIEVPFATEDAGGRDDGELAARLRAEANRPFDLTAGPLLRVRLYARVGHHVLLVAIHHAVTDFWSLGVLLDELGALYPALAAGREPELEPPPLQYADFARWQRRRLAAPEGERLRAYWLERLGGDLPATEMRTDRQRPRARASAGAVHGFRLDRGLSERLEAFGRGRRATPFMTLAAVFEVLLARHTGQRELVLGTVGAARTHALLGRLPGYFVNPLALRADLCGRPGFAEVLTRVRRDVIGAFEHQDYPFATLVERLRPERDPGRSPIFDVLFVLQQARLADGQDLTGFAFADPRTAVEVGGLRLAPVPFEQGLAQFDLTLNMGRVDDGYAATFDYDPQLFDAVSVERLAAHFVRLAAGLVEEPRSDVALVCLLAAAEERQIVETWNATARDYPREATVADLFEAQAARTPDADAVFAAGERLTYGQLDGRANKLARHLQARGVGPETLVAICLERSTDLIAAVLGVLKAGGAYLPLDPAYPRERLAAAARAAGARLVVARDAYRPFFATDSVALERDAAAIAALPAQRPARSSTARNLAAVIFTSGSTGEPKGVALEHRPLVNMIASFLGSYRPGAEDRILPLTSIASASFVGEILPMLAAGGALVLPEEREVLDLDALLALLERQAVTIVSTVPAVSANLNAFTDRLPRLRLLLVGGEALAAGDVHRLIGRVEVVNGYGLTETAVCSTCYRLGPADFAAGARLAIGKPVANTRVYVLDPRGRPSPAGVAGEIFVGGDGLARAYLSEAATTAARFVPDPYGNGGRLYRTGDLGAWRFDGNLEFLGRRDRQISLRGFRIELGEIESAVTLVGGVRDAAVTVREDVPGQKRLVAYVVPEGAEGDAEAILGALRERLPGYMVPSALVFLPALPLRSSGKVDVERLPAPPARRAAAEALPRSALERAVAEVWRQELGVAEVGLDDNFFDLGGHSLLMTKVHQRLKAALGRELSLIELFQYPSVGTLARHLAGGETAAVPRRERRARAGGGEGGVAVIGVAGRFPGAASPEELWHNLAEGIETIHVFTDDELLAAGVAPELVRHPDYVKAKGVLGDVDLFDAGFFGLNPREVELMDPQHRLFLECSWEALEDAGYDPERYPGLVGVYGGESMNTYLLTNLLSHLELVASADTLQASLGNDKDPLTSRVAYKLDLRGPSVTVQTASSTSLAAVHVAARSLQVGDCDMALAGGVSIHLPEATGYFYQEGGTTSKDGHTRAFDARSTGFVSGHGAGVVVLKRLEDAVADGDHVYAVIKGSACNNDGTAKVSFMAPSVDGQVAVYRQAYEDAGVSPATVSYVECHGTGTALGDPIEIGALTRAFAEHTGERGYCAVGSLKTNVGHLDAAAGVCGLIKATLSLHHGAIPASLHFEKPNPRIDFAASPFFVNTELRPWTRGEAPRRAGVTSLGMGGTNVHAVLEEAPPSPPPSPSRPWQLLLLSARSAGALDAATERLAARLHRRELPLPDVTYTLQVGRKALEHRRMLLCRDRDDALAALGDPGRLRTAVHRPGDRPVAFLFTGQGSQYPDMGRGLYEAEPSFRDDVDRCARLLEPQLGFDLRAALFVEDAASKEAAARLRQTEVTQPALFTVSWATARLWTSWGVKPSAMIGHSLGEYVAACLAEVMTLEDALALVALRGRLMQRMPPGAMATVELPEAEVAPLLGEELSRGELSLAAVNRPSDCVVSGPADAVDRLLAELARRDVGCRRLHTSHAYHSRMIEPMLRPFAEAVAKVRLEPPRIPYVSNVTGTWIRPEEATDPAYWARHVRATVRFADGLGELLAEPRRILLEVGPGSTLASLARQHPARGEGHAVLSSLRHPKEDEADLPFLLDALGRLWLAGGEVDWAGFYAGETRRRVPLPTYPFERQRYWVEPLPEGAKKRRGRLAIDDWFYVPAWKRVPLPVGGVPAGGDWLLFVDDGGLGDALARRLRAAGSTVTAVTSGDAFARVGDDAFRLVPGRAEDYEALLEALGRVPPRVVHLWNVGRGAGAEEALERAFYSPLFLARALGQRDAEVDLTVVASGLHEVTGGEAVEPLKAALLGPCGVAPREYARLRCRAIDVELGGPRLVEQILRETAAPASPLVALRGRHRWVRDFEAVALAEEAPRLRPRGVYLVTGGRGGLGLEIAGELARQARARLVLVGRSPVPPRAEWAAAEDAGIRRLAALEALGAEVLALAADVADAGAMRRVKEQAEARFGPVNGVIHAAGVPGAGLIRAKEREAAERVLRPKVAGLLVLDELFRDAGLDFFVSLSTITAVLPEPGQVDYVAANAVLDAFASANGSNGEWNDTLRAAINWDAWREVGMAVRTEVPEGFRAWRQKSLAEGLSSAEGVAAFRRILASGLSQVVVSTHDLAIRRQENALFRPLDELASPAAAAAVHARPADLTTPYAPPESELERQVAAVWQEILGIEQIGADDNFFELGGNSLAGIRITQRLKERLGANISDVSIYEGPTVRALAKLMTTDDATEEAPAALVAAHESRERGERRRARLARRRAGADGGES